MKIMRKIIEIDQEKCDGCGNCVPSCAEGAIEIIDGKAKVVKDQYCDGLGACLGECPQDALRLVEREADAFDEAAVEAFLKSKENSTDKASAPASTGCGCPSETLHTFSTPDKGACQAANRPVVLGESTSALGHWPVQIRLVPPTAPFLKDADLLVTADCVPIAYASFHQDFLKDKVVMMGCPKFDDKDAYVEKFAQIFAANTIKSITVLIMEVPCCSGLPGILKRAMALADKEIQLTTTVISARGKIVEPKKINAGTMG